MTEKSLATVLSEMSRDGDTVTFPIPENWMQGRTTFGGLTTALLLAAARENHADLPPLRSTLINFTGPVDDSPRITTDILRAGRNVTTVAVDATADGRPAARATFTFGAARESVARLDHPAPEAPWPPETLAPFIPPQARDFAPRFALNFDWHLIDGHRPLAGAAEGYMRCWVRHKDPASRSGEIALLCLADILPPGVYPILKRMGPNSSVTWICNFLDDDLGTKDGWWQVETRLTAARDGYASQVMRAWNTDGRLVIDGMQSVAIFV